MQKFTVDMVSVPSPEKCLMLVTNMYPLDDT